MEMGRWTIGIVGIVRIRLIRRQMNKYIKEIRVSVLDIVIGTVLFIICCIVFSAVVFVLGI